ncbi:MAG: PorT family protein, partial [Bacteroidales bacterium]|nr:PorT family protein [Bacteroidales bacterium]
MRRFLVSIIVFILLFISAGLFGQKAKVHNLPAYDVAPYHFGFTIGLNQMLFTIKPMPDINTKVYYEVSNAVGDIVADSAMVLGINSNPTFGFDIGIVGDKRLGRYFNLRFVPALSFGERYLNYSIKAWQNGEVKLIDLKKNVGSVFIDFPILVKYKSKRLNNMLAYVEAGGKYSLDIASNARTEDISGQIIVKLN